LARRDHSRHELDTKAVQKGYDPGFVTSILNELEQNGYINNMDFARKYAADKFSLQKWGPVKIRSELIRKGVDKQVIDQVLLKETEDFELNKICVDLILKRKCHFSRESDSYKRKQKIASYLQRRGFSFDTINRVLPDIINRLNV
jgi:regulatory protein